MYKLLIADDEPLERQAIRYFIENSHLEIGEILESENGTATVKTAMIEQPDIIILDIKMPGLTGLEAMERIITTNKNCKVIFSTAYSYFDYAVKALKLGAIDFLVKPVKKEVLIGILNKAIDQLDAESGIENKEFKLDELIQILGKKILGELIFGKIDEETLYYLDAIDVDSNTAGNTLVVKLEKEVSVAKSQQIQSTLRKDLSAAGYHSIIRIDHRSLTMVVFSTSPDLQQNLVNTIEIILASIFRDLKLAYTYSMGMAFEDVSGIEQSYIDAYGKIYELLKEESGPSFELEPLHHQRTIPAEDLNIPNVVQSVCSYIQDHYQDKITLDNIAELVKYSKYYVGRIFKQYMKVTIVDYLIQIRLKKAKELLLDGSYSIKQISYMVGYTEPNYFTWAFKKLEGISPAKYRYSQRNH